MYQFILIVYIYSFLSFSGFCQVHRQIPTGADKGDILKNGETYVLASVDSSGRLHIKTSNSRNILIQKDTAQVGFDDIVISDDGQKIGWLALYDNAATSYPIPLELNIYTGGEIHKFTGTGLPIWLWHFTADGRHVAYEQETVHGGLGVHYELRVIATGQLTEMYELGSGPNNQPLEIQKNVPKWVEELNNSR